MGYFLVGLVVHPRVGLGVRFLLGVLGENSSAEEGCLANLGRILLEIAEVYCKLPDRAEILL